MGEALEPVRHQVVIATKFGFSADAHGRGAQGVDSRPAHIKQSVEGSLKRLRTDCIDLLYQHRVDPEVPIEDVAGAVRDLIQAGKVRYFGMSEAGVATVRRAHAVQPVAALQNEYSLCGGDDRKRNSSPCVRNSPSDWFPYSPLGKGYLTGTMSPHTQFDAADIRGRVPRLSPEAQVANRPMVDMLEGIARKKKATAAQIALAWLLAQKPWIVPIPGTTRLDRVEENIAAAAVELTPADLQEIEVIILSFPIEGGRYPHDAEKMTNL